MASEVMQTLYEWFGIVGIEPPAEITSIATLIPYLIQVSVALMITGMVFGALVKIAGLFTEWRWR